MGEKEKKEKKNKKNGGKADEEFTVKLKKSKGKTRLGLVASNVRGKGLRIKELRAGLIQEWNKANPKDKVMPTDMIVAVNGKGPGAANNNEMIKELRSATELVFTMRKGARPGSKK